MRSDGAGGAVDPVVAEVAAMLARLGALAVEPAPGTDADRIDRIAAFERMRGALAAAQQGRWSRSPGRRLSSTSPTTGSIPPRSGVGSATRSG
jgi:hypothetical protein